MNLWIPINGSPINQCFHSSKTLTICCHSFATILRFNNMKGKYPGWIMDKCGPMSNCIKICFAIALQDKAAQKDSSGKLIIEKALEVFQRYSKGNFLVIPLSEDVGETEWVHKNDECTIDKGNLLAVRYERWCLYPDSTIDHGLLALFAIGIDDSVAKRSEDSRPLFQAAHVAQSNFLIENSAKNKATFVTELSVVDPDPGGDVNLVVFKDDTSAGLFAIDGSFIEQEDVTHTIEPFNHSLVELVE